MRKDNCKHFNGFQYDTCQAGINFMELAGGKRDGIALRLPCCAALRSELEAHPDLTKVECPNFEL
jgi:hypothetical protein